MDAQVSQLLHDKRFWVAGGLAAAIGLGVWWQRRHANSSAAASGQMVAGGAGGVGSFDSTGSDIAAALGDQTGQVQDVLQQFLNQLQGTLAGAGQIPPAHTPSPTPTPTPVSTLPPPASPPPRPHTVTVEAYTRNNTKWDSTLSGIAAHEHTTLQALERLNPSITNPNIIHVGQQIRVS